MDAKAVRRSEPAMWYGVAAAKQAIADAGLEITDENREDIGVVFGTGAGGQTLMIDNWHVLDRTGARARRARPSSRTASWTPRRA